MALFEADKVTVPLVINVFELLSVTVTVETVVPSATNSLGDAEILDVVSGVSANTGIKKRRNVPRRKKKINPRIETIRFFVCIHVYE